MHINRILFYWSQYLGADPKEIMLISSLLVTVSLVGFFQIVSLRTTSTATPSYDEQYHEFVERSQAFEQSYEKIVGSVSDSLSLRSNILRSDSGDTLTINMNIATLKEWVQLLGIGEVYAQRILEHRNTHEDFTRLEDLMEVKGIGQKWWEKLEIHLYIEFAIE